MLLSEGHLASLRFGKQICDTHDCCDKLRWGLSRLSHLMQCMANFQYKGGSQGTRGVGRGRGRDVVTHNRASAGQSENQLMVQQLTKVGSWRQRSLKVSPMGLMHSTMCSLARTRSTKAFHRGPGASGTPCAVKLLRASSSSLLRSSSPNKPAGTRLHLNGGPLPCQARRPRGTRFEFFG